MFFYLHYIGFPGARQKPHLSSMRMFQTALSCFVFTSLVVLTARCSMSGSSLRKRVGSTSENGAADVCSEFAPKGGVKKRLALEQKQNDPEFPEASGGIRRRLQATGPNSQTGEAQPFSAELRKMWAKGELKSPQVQKLAKTASEQHAMGLGKLAKDSNPKHACRDLQRALGWPTGCPEFEWINLPSPHTETGGFMNPHPIICPISLVEKTFQADEQKFHRFLAGDAAENASYWYNMRHHCTYKRIERYVHPQNSSPVSIHGDGAPTNKTDSLFTIQWSTDTVSGTTLEKTNIFTVLPKGILHNGVLETVWDRMAWSFNTLLTGVFPERDWRGRLHPRRGQKVNMGKHNFVCGRMRGDWEFYVQVLNYPRWDALHCCWLCDATNCAGDLCWTRVDDNAGWRATIKTHESILAGLRALGIDPPGLYKIVSLFHEGITIDSLHAVDQGPACHAVANCFCEVMALGQWGRNQADQVKGLQDYIHTWQTKNKETCRLRGKLTFSRLKTGSDWPKLKAKAGECRHLIDCCVALCREYDDGSSWSQRRRGCIEALKGFYDVLYTEGRFLSEAAKKNIVKHGKNFFILYTQLAEDSAKSQPPIRAWKLTPKFHLLLHLVEIQSMELGNPRYYWTYMDEDLQQIMKKIALTCHAKHIAPLLIYKWLILKFD